MKILLKDVLHLYVGAKGEAIRETQIVPEASVSAGSLFFVTGGFLQAVSTGDLYDNFILHLRDIDSLTDDEIAKLFMVVKSPAAIKICKANLANGVFTAIGVKELLKLGVDLFGLIESGQAKKIEPATEEK